ncbi:MAG: YmfQ family protein [Oscillospiraceae bacterium]|nr:YmfQ family protein [Oscillospiraceae bacterium]
MDRQMMEYLPPVLQRCQDFACLMGAYQGKFSDIWRSLWEIEDELYLKTAGETGILRWEQLLGIVSGEALSLEDRRQIILARIGWWMPYNWFAFLKFLTALTGDRNGFAATLTGFQLEIILKPGWRGLRAAVWELVRQIVPANIAVQLVLVYSRHWELSAMTHRELGRYTHRRIRDEVR